MNSRRRFFNELMKAAAIVALAPQLAFKTKPELWVLNPTYSTAQHDLYTFVGVSDGKRILAEDRGFIIFYCKPSTWEALQRM